MYARNKNSLLVEAINLEGKRDSDKKGPTSTTTTTNPVDSVIL